MIITKNLLFSERDLSNILRGHLLQTQREVDRIDKSTFQTNSDDQIIKHIYSKMEILPLEINPDAGELTEPQETDIQVKGRRQEEIYFKGVELEYDLPYSGESDLWKFTPSNFTYTRPVGDVIPDRKNDLTCVLRIKLFFKHSDLSINGLPSFNSCQ